MFNQGERKASVIMSWDSIDTRLLVSFQAAEVHKPVLAVSRSFAAGHKVHFDDVDPHILHMARQQFAMTSNGGMHEVETWIDNPGTPAASVPCGRPSR